MAASSDRQSTMCGWASPARTENHAPPMAGMAGWRDGDARVDHVGSLLRPQILRAARDAHAGAELAPASFEAAEDRAVRGSVALQEELGLPGADDDRHAGWICAAAWLAVPASAGRCLRHGGSGLPNAGQ